MIEQYIFGGLIILAALLLFIVGVSMFYQEEINGFIPIFLGIVFMLAGVTIITAKNRPTKEMATDFMNCFKDLLEIAKPLI